MVLGKKFTIQKVIFFNKIHLGCAHFLRSPGLIRVSLRLHWNIYAICIRLVFGKTILLKLKLDPYKNVATITNPELMIDNDPLDTTIREINKKLNILYRGNGKHISHRLLNKIKIKKVKIGTFNIIPKLHKPGVFRS